MKVLDLFCGLKGWSQAFSDRGHDIITVDIDPKFNPTISKNVLDLTAKDFMGYGTFDIVLASPPCEAFSVMAISKNWRHGIPKGVLFNNFRG